MKFYDAQQALSFLVNQASHIEPQVYAVKYPDIQYPQLVPIDTSANEWSRTVTFFSQDKVGAANWFAADSNDIPRADIVQDKHEHTIHMAAIGYGYNLEELGAAMLVPNTNLTADRGMAARRAYEEFMDNLVLRGASAKGMLGLMNYTGVTAANVPNGAGGQPGWATKTGLEIAKDINDALTGVYSSTLTVELADTVLLPVAMFTLIANTIMNPNGGNETILSFILRSNTYTAVTGQPLTIRAVRGLESAGAAGTGRMVVYRRDPQVLKVHLPMPHRFLPVWQTGPLRFDVPGVFRTGGLEIRRPGAVRYSDAINPA
jgi:hypothetical protein